MKYQKIKYCDHVGFLWDCNICRRHHGMQPLQPEPISHPDQAFSDVVYFRQRNSLLEFFTKNLHETDHPEPQVDHIELLEEIMWAGSTAKWASLQVELRNTSSGYSDF